MPYWERNISEHDIVEYTHIATDKCFCSQVATKQSTVFLWMIALKTHTDNVGNSSKLTRMTYKQCKSSASIIDFK